MPKTDHWRTAYKGEPEGPLPYVETEEAFDRVQAGPKITREELGAIKARIDALETQAGPGGEVTQVQLREAIKTAGDANKTALDAIERDVQKADAKAAAADAKADANKDAISELDKRVRKLGDDINIPPGADIFEGGG